jgi:outer membrane lipoprotein-sorting protein
MKPLLRLLLASASLIPAVLSAASFEGKVSFKTSLGGKTQDVTQSIKGDKIRMEVKGQREMSGMIMDLTKKEMMMIMDEQRMYMTMAIPESAVQAVEKHKEESTLEKTGETERILGYTATKYISTEKNGKTEMWLAEGIGTFVSPNQGNPMAGGRRGAGPQQQGWERALAGKELFPLRVVTKDKADKETSRMEVTAIEKQKLPDSLFAPPEGYQKFDMGGMMKGMIPGFGK